MKFEEYISPSLLYENILKNTCLITEKEKVPVSNVRIIVLTNKKEEDSKKDNLFRTAQRFKEVCEKRNIEFYTVFAESAHIMRSEKGVYFVYNAGDKIGFEISDKNTVAIIRGSVGRYNSSLDLVSQLERIGIFCVNNRETVENCSDKFRTILKIADSGLPSPKTALIQSMDTLEHSLEVVENKFPLIIKTLKGSKGVGVLFVESLRSLKSILQMIWKINDEEELLIQQYIKIPFDIRVHVLGGKVIASMKRYVIADDFRSNYSLGGKVEKITITKEEEEICILASKTIGSSWCAVDLIRDEKGKPYIIEINSSPGTEGIEKATGKDIISMVIDYVSDSNNWIKVPKECGFIETIEIDGMGKFKAKMDTGNGSNCVIHSDKHKIEKNMVTWFQGDKKYSHKLKEIKEVDIGGLQDYTEERPVIELDVLFDNVLHKKVEFTLSDRGKRIHTPILLNRIFMRNANISINPAKTYVLSKED